MSGSKHARGAAWAVLLSMGGTTMAYNVYHATYTGRLNLGLALLYGVAPVGAAMGLSHIVASHKGGWFMKATAFLVMLGAMALSMGATSAVVGPSAGSTWMALLFGVVLDAAALVALQVILAPRPEPAKAGTRARVQNAGSGRKQSRNRAEVPPRKQPASSAPSSAPEPEPAAELDTEAQALLILAAEPDISGSQLGRRLGKSDRYGRELIKKLAKAAPGGLA